VADDWTRWSSISVIATPLTRRPGQNLLGMTENAGLDGDGHGGGVRTAQC